MLSLGPARRQRTGWSQTGTHVAMPSPCWAGRGLGESFTSGFKASTFLLLAFFKFTKLPVTRLRIMIKEHFKCHCPVTYQPLPKVAREVKRRKKQDLRCQLWVGWGHELMGPEKERMKNKEQREERLSLTEQRSASCLWSFEVPDLSDRYRFPSG